MSMEWEVGHWKSRVYSVCFFLNFRRGSKQPWHASAVLFTCTSELETLDFFYLCNQWSPLSNDICVFIFDLSGASGSEPEPEEIYRRPAALEAQSLICQSRDRKPLRKDIMLIMTRICLFGKDVQKIVYFGF